MKMEECKGVEDLNDDEIMELGILSNNWTACETKEILNLSRFVSHAARLGLREASQNFLREIQGVPTSPRC